MIPFIIAGAIGYGIAKLLEEDKAPKYADGGLIAPNGKPSNLTSEQYELVRTKAFKNWFGDWENDPENASKVVDENGEPLVVYHGSNAEFYKFEKSKGKGNIKQKSINFSSNKNVSENYGTRIIECFLNLKNPFIKNYNGENYHTITFYARLDNRINDIPDNIVNNTQTEKKYDSVIFLNIKDSKSAYDKFSVPIANNYYAFNNNQIKLADGTNTTFDGNNPDIRFDEGGTIDLSYEVPNLDEKITFHEFEYEFKTENNVKYVVQCLIRWREQQDVIRYTDKNGVKKRRLKERADMVLSIAFGTKSRAKDKYGNNNISLRVKNKGEVYRVMATIVKIVKKILKEKTDITFVQFKPMGIDEGDNRRLILYTRAIKKEYPNSLIETGYGEYVLDKKGFENFNRNFFGIKINRKQMKFAKGGSVLLAPNGKPSNLTPEQYKLVRTLEFKAWFGDWENDPANASKVVDENGEPLVVYHGTNTEFNEFKPSVKALASHTKRIQPIFFSPNFQFASAYGRNVKSIFLNIRKLFYGRKLNQEQEDYFYDLILNDEIKKGTNEDSAIEHAYQTLRNLKLGSWGVLESDFMWDFYKQYNYNGFIVDEGYENYAVFDSNQIKLADGTNTTFDSNNPDIRFMAGGITQPRDLTQIVNYQNIYKGADYYSYSDNLEKQEKADRWFELFITNQKERQLTAQEFSEFMQLSNELIWDY